MIQYDRRFMECKLKSFEKTPLKPNGGKWLKWLLLAIIVLCILIIGGN